MNLGKGEKPENIQCIECTSPFIWFTHAMPPPSPCCNLSIVTWLERTPANPSLPIQHLLCLSQTEMFSHSVFALFVSRFWTATHSIKPHSYRLLIIEGMGFNEESFKNPVAPRFVGGVITYKVPQKCDNLPSFTCFTFTQTSLFHTFVD